MGTHESSGRSFGPIDAAEVCAGLAVSMHIIRPISIRYPHISISPQPLLIHCHPSRHEVPAPQIGCNIGALKVQNSPPIERCFYDFRTVLIRQPKHRCIAVKRNAHSMSPAKAIPPRVFQLSVGIELKDAGLGLTKNNHVPAFQRGDPVGASVASCRFRLRNPPQFSIHSNLNSPCPTSNFSLLT